MLKSAKEYLKNYGTELEKQLLCEQYEEINGAWIITTRPMKNDDIIFAYMQYMKQYMK